MVEPLSPIFPASLWTVHRFKKISAFVLKFGITFGILYLIFSKVKLNGFASKMLDISPAVGAGVIVLLGGHVILSAMRWRMVIGCLGKKVGWRAVISATLFERFINQAIPSTVSGDAGRVIVLKRQGLTMSVSVLSVIFDRALAIGGIVIAVAFGLPLVFRLFPDPALQHALIGIVGVSIVAVGVVLLMPGALLDRIAQVKGLRHVATLVKTTQTLFAIPRFSLIGFGTSFAAQIFLVAAFQLIAVDLGAALSFTAAFAVVPAMTLISLIPVTLAGWGVRESVAVMLLPYVGVSAENALAISILYGLLTLAIACAGGIFWLVMQMFYSVPDGKM